MLLVIKPNGKDSKALYKELYRVTSGDISVTDLITSLAFKALLLFGEPIYIFVHLTFNVAIASVLLINIIFVQHALKICRQSSFLNRYMVFHYKLQNTIPSSMLFAKTVLIQSGNGCKGGRNARRYQRYYYVVRHYASPLW